MNCLEYQQLSFQEKCVMIGQVVHLIQNHSDSFRDISSMLRGAAQRGKFDDVIILPPPEKINDEVTHRY